MSHTYLNPGPFAIVGFTHHMAAQTDKFQNHSAGRRRPGTLSLFEKQEKKVLIFLTTIALFFFMVPMASASAVITPAGDPGRTPANPFDYSNVTVTSNSPTYNAGSDIRDIFGGSFSTLEAPGRTIFSDRPGQLATYDVKFTTNAAVSLAGYSLFLGEDGGGSLNRSATNFELLANGRIVSNVGIVSAGQNYSVRFGSDSISVSDSFAPISATTFEAIFTSNIGFNNGIRILGFQAITGAPSGGQSSNPEPSTISLALLAGVAFVAFFRRQALH